MATNDYRPKLFKWAVRKSPQLHSKWAAALRDVCEDEGILVSLLTGGVPSLSDVVKRTPNLDSQQQMIMYNELLVEYQTVNTAYYRVVFASLILTERDIEMVERDFVQQTGSARDGAGLREWAAEFGSTTGFKEQAALILRVEAYACSPTASINQLVEHCTSLLQDWLRVEGNNVARLKQYYHRLLMSVPTEPAANKVALMRVWLGTKVVEEHPLLAKPYDLFDLMEKHALAIGMREDASEGGPQHGGGAGNGDTAMGLNGGNGRPFGPGGDGRRHPPGGPEPKYGLKQNNCDLCTSSMCVGNEKGGGPLNCSNFNPLIVLKDASPRQIAHVKVGRAYIGDHPKCVSLKKIELTLRSQKPAEGRGSGTDATRGRPAGTGAAMTTLASGFDGGAEAEDFKTWWDANRPSSSSGKSSTFGEEDSILTLGSPIGSGEEVVVLGRDTELDDDVAEGVRAALVAEREQMQASMQAAEQAMQARLAEVEARAAASAETSRVLQLEVQASRNSSATPASAVCATAVTKSLTNALTTPNPSLAVQPPSAVPNSALAAFRTSVTNVGNTPLTSLIPTNTSVGGGTTAGTAPTRVDDDMSATEHLALAVAQEAKYKRLRRLKREKMGLLQYMLTGLFHRVSELTQALFAGITVKDALLLLLGAQAVAPRLVPYLGRLAGLMTGWVGTACFTQLRCIVVRLLALVTRAFASLTMSAASATVSLGQATLRNLPDPESGGSPGAPTAQPLHAASAAPLSPIAEGPASDSWWTGGTRQSLSALGSDSELPDGWITRMRSHHPDDLCEENAALFDSGATLDCKRDLDGRIPGTYRESTTGPITVGNSENMKSHGSHLFAHKRMASDGTAQYRIDRMTHTPDLPYVLVYSEPVEQNSRRSTICAAPDQPRTVTTAAGSVYPLHVTPNGLSWWKYEAITDEITLRKLFSSTEHLAALTDAPQPMCALGVNFDSNDGWMTAGAMCVLMTPQSDLSDAVLAVGSNAPATTVLPPNIGVGRHVELGGLELLNRTHLVLGHASLPRCEATLKLAGLWGRVKKCDVVSFGQAPCAMCETMMMKRRHFAVQPADNTPLPPGKHWALDTLCLRVPSAQHGFHYITRFVDKSQSRKPGGAPAKKRSFAHVSMSAESFERLFNRHRAWCRPAHGEIWIHKHDSLPVLTTGRLIQNYLSDHQIRQDISAPYVHEGVGEVESTFMHDVPAAMALVKGAGDKDERHFVSAFLCHENASGHTADARSGLTANMGFFGYKHTALNTLLVYGSPCKYLEHPEVRDSKFDDHALPGSYRGPSREDESESRCWVWNGSRYVTVDIGCMRVDERSVTARSSRKCAANQPFETDPDAPAPDADFTDWHHAAQQSRTKLWQRTDPAPVGEFIVYAFSGPLHDDDYDHVIRKQSANRPTGPVTVVCIDNANGGYEQDLSVKEVLTAVIALLQLPNCLALLLTPSCNWWCGYRLRKDKGPAQLFALPDHTGGVVSLDPATQQGVRAGLVVAQIVVRLITERAAHVILFLEHTVSRAAGSPFAIVGHETHSTLLDVPSVAAAIVAEGARCVYFDSCAVGETSQKSRVLVVSRQEGERAARTIGTRRCNGQHTHESTDGLDASGIYKTARTARLPRMLLELIATISLAPRYAQDPPDGGPAAATEGTAAPAAATEGTGRARAPKEVERTAAADRPRRDGATPQWPMHRLHASMKPADFEAEIGIIERAVVEVQRGSTEPEHETRASDEAKLPWLRMRLEQLAKPAVTQAPLRPDESWAAWCHGPPILARERDLPSHQPERLVAAGAATESLRVGFTAPLEDIDTSDMRVEASKVQRTAAYDRPRRHPVHADAAAVKETATRAPAATPGRALKPSQVSAATASAVPMLESAEQRDAALARVAERSGHAVTNLTCASSDDEMATLVDVSTDSAPDTGAPGSTRNSRCARQAREAAVAHDLRCARQAREMADAHWVRHGFVKVGVQVTDPSLETAPKAPPASVERDVLAEMAADRASKFDYGPKAAGDIAEHARKLAAATCPEKLARTTFGTAERVAAIIEGLPAERRHAARERAIAALLELVSSDSDGDDDVDAPFGCSDHVAMVAEQQWRDGHDLPSNKAETIPAHCVSVQLDMTELGGEWFQSEHMLFAVSSGKAYSVDTKNCAHWHVPKNEKEYARSPQKHIWRTARELKMDEYIALKMFRLVPRADVLAAGHTICGSLWAQSIKTDKEGVYEKANPRWCLMGGKMDRTKFKSFCDVMYRSSLKMMACLLVTYELVHFSFDGKNAFQNTRADGPDDPELHCDQAPGFVQYGPKGEKMCCKVLVGMQGRIDAMAMHARRWAAIWRELGCVQHSTDPKQWIYHKGPGVGTDAPLEEVLKLIAAEPATAAGEPPIGWLTFGAHVDDGFGVSSSIRASDYIIDGMAVQYEMKRGPWTKPVGYSVRFGEDGKSVAFECLAVIRDAIAVHCDGEVTVAPKHPYPMNITSLEPDEDPPLVGSVAYPEYARALEKRRALLGLLLWISEMYGHRMRLAANVLCGHMAFPSAAVYKAAKHLLLHMGTHGEPITYRGSPTGSLVLAEPTVAPFTEGQMEFGLHYFCDADLGLGRSLTGYQIFLGGAAFESTSIRQHLATPESHSAEVTAAGTALMRVVAHRQYLQELRVPQVNPTPGYIDSLSTLLVAAEDGAPKRSIWIKRRIEVLTDFINLGEVALLHIDEADNVADGLTKPIKHTVFIRHTEYIDGTHARRAIELARAERDEHVAQWASTTQWSSGDNEPPPSPPPSPPSSPTDD